MKKLNFSPLEMLVLNMLSQKEMYGYEMLEYLKNKTDGEFDIKAGTLYPVLHGLESDGCIESRSQTVENGRIRKFYAITEIGTARLKKAKKEWNVFCTAVDKSLG